jgi:hypothetical protein
MSIIRRNFCGQLIRNSHVISRNFSSSNKITEETAAVVIQRIFDRQNQPVDPKILDKTVEWLYKEAMKIDPNKVGASEGIIETIAAAIHSKNSKQCQD